MAHGDRRLDVHRGHKHILGIQLDFAGLVIDPCIPADWPGFEVQRQWRGATYAIKVGTRGHAQKGVKSVTLNGKPVTGPIPPQAAGSTEQGRGRNGLRSGGTWRVAATASVPNRKDPAGQSGGVFL